MSCKNHLWNLTSDEQTAVTALRFSVSTHNIIQKHAVQHQFYNHIITILLHLEDIVYIIM